MTLPGKVLAFLRRLFASLIWFAFAPKDWDPELQNFKVKTYNLKAGQEKSRGL